MRITAKYNSNLELSVCLSLITAQPLEINDIEISNGGLTSAQNSFLELLDKITDGATFDINETGCRLRVIPGTLIGGEIDHECDMGAAIGYYAMYLSLLAPFCKKPIVANLYGVTNRQCSISVEHMYYGLAAVVKEIVSFDAMFEIVVKKRGAFPDGGGLAVFTAKPVQSLKPLEKIKIGKIQKVRGTSWSTRINPTLGKRQIDGAKPEFTKYLSDVFIIHDHKKQQESGNSPGYGIVLTAVTTEGVAYSAEVNSKCREECGSVASIPEDLGKEAAQLLTREIVRGGVCSSMAEPILLAMLALGKKNVSKVILGVPSAATIQALKDIKLFTGVKFSIEPIRAGSDNYKENCGEQLLFSCVGSGIVNLNRSIR